MFRYRGRCEECKRLYTGVDRHYCSEACAGKRRERAKYRDLVDYWESYYRRNPPPDNEAIVMQKRQMTGLFGGAYLRAQEGLKAAYARQVKFWAIRKAKESVGYKTEDVKAKELLQRASANMYGE